MDRMSTSSGEEDDEKSNVGGKGPNPTFPFTIDAIAKRRAEVNANLLPKARLLIDTRSDELKRNIECHKKRVNTDLQNQIDPGWPIETVMHYLRCRTERVAPDVAANTFGKTLELARQLRNFDVNFDKIRAEFGMMQETGIGFDETERGDDFYDLCYWFIVDSMAFDALVSFFPPVPTDYMEKEWDGEKTVLIHPMLGEYPERERALEIIGFRRRTGAL